MPFTFSHPALVLPLKRILPAWFSTTGLVFGSLAPDFPYFLKLDGSSDFGHTLAGVFLLDLPLSFLIAIAFHHWYRNILIRHLPAPLDRQHADGLSFCFLDYLKRGWLLFAVSALVGIVSHLVWDEFAKPDGYVYAFAPPFFNQSIRLGPFDPPLYVVTERVGAIVGFLILVWVIFRKNQEASPVHPVPGRQKVCYWVSVALGTAIFFSIAFVLGKEGASFGHYVIVLLSAGLFAFALATPLFNFMYKTNKQAGEPPQS